MVRSVRGLLTATLAASFLALVYGTAQAALTTDQQKCVSELNKGLTKTADTIGKEINACVKDYAKQKGVTDIPACVDQDRKGKVAKAELKASEGDTKKCVGNDKNGVPKRPSVFATDSATVIAAAHEKEAAVLEAIFGSDVNGAVLTEAANKDGSKCQQTIAKDALKCETTKLKEFEKCKKAAMKSGADANAALEACVLADPKGKIAKACGKIAADLQKKCVDKGQDLCTLFPHCCPPCTGGDAACVAACIDAPIECATCLAINAADNLNADCDLLDDGIDNGSCDGPPPPPICGDNIVNQPGEDCDGTDDAACPGKCLPDCTCPPEIGSHKCVLDPSQSSVLVIHPAFTLPVPGVGAVDISCGAVDPGTGKAPCDCELQDFEPFELSSIGYVCILPLPAGSCATGEIDCDGGNALDVTVVQDHTIGTCTSQADCEAQCTAYCGAETPFNPACEGFCIGGTSDGSPCTADSQCPGGSCPGPDGGHVTSHQCGCGCMSVGGAPSAAGSLQCEVGVSIVVEYTGPACGDDPRITLGKTCIPVTTEMASGVIVNANMGAGTLPAAGPLIASGAPGDCAALANSMTTGMKTVGFVGFFDSSLGDLGAQITFTCQ